MLEFMKLGFAQIAFGGEDSGGGGGGGGSDNAPASSPRPTQRPDRPAPAPAPRDDGPSDADRNRQALLESQMQQEQRGRATQEAAAVAADRNRQAAAQQEAARRAEEQQQQEDEARQAADRQRQRQEAARRMEEQQEQEDRARAPARVTAPTPPAAVDEFSGLPPSMTDSTYVPPSSTSSMIGTGDPVLDALLPASAQPSFTYAPPVAPMTNPLGLAPAPSTQDSFLDGALAETQYNILNEASNLGTGIGSLAEAFAPRSIANVGYGEGEIDRPLARAAGITTDRVAVGDPNPVTQGALRAAEALNVSGDRVFRNMSPEQQANITDPLYTAEGGVNLPALGSGLYQGGISLATTLGSFFLNPTLGLAVGGAQGSGQVAGGALEKVDNFATANNLTPAERSAMESAALETSALYAPIGALSAAIYGSRLPLGAKVAVGSAEEATEEGFVQPSAGATIGNFAIAPDDFRMRDVELQYDPKGATIGAILGGAAAGAVGGGAGRTSGPAPAPTGGRGTAPTPGGLPVAPTTPGVLQIPGTDVVVNTAPVTPMVQAPTLRAPAALGTGGAFQPGVTQQGAIITPAAPARPALPAPDAQPTADLQTAADIIDAGLARDGGVGSETFQAVDEATGGRLNMMDVQAIMEQRMAERNAAQAFDPEAALARLQSRFPGARSVEPSVDTTPPAQLAFDPDAALARLRGQFPGIQTVADTAGTQGLPTTQTAVDLQNAADIIDAGLARDGGLGSETFQAVDEATGGRLNMMDVQAIMEQRMAERNAAQAFDPDAALARLQARFPGARLAEPTVDTAPTAPSMPTQPVVGTTPPAQPAFDPEAALERLRGQFPGIRTVEDTAAAQQAPALPVAPTIDAPPTVAPSTSLARTEGVTEQPVQEFVFDGEILGPELEVSTDVVLPQEGVIIDQTIPRDLTVPTQRPVPRGPVVSTEPELASEQETSPLVLVSTVDDEPPVEREQAPAVVQDEEDTGGGEGGEDTEVSVEVEPDEDGECPPGFVRRLVDGQFICVPEEEEVLEEEEEPPFECPPGFRRVQMANGGFTCVPEMARPRVGPFTGTVDVSGLEGRTVFRPGTRRT
jgi:hypothetical protein